MKNNVFLWLLILCSIVSSAQEITSPNGKIKLQVLAPKNNQVLTFSVSYILNRKSVTVLPQSMLGITREDEDFTKGLQLISVYKPTAIHDKYTTISGKRMERENFGTERTFSFVNRKNKPLNIIFRVYNDGVAFRYEFPDTSSEPVNITSESTTYVLPEGTVRWMQPFQVSYEDFYPESVTGKGEKSQQWGFPALYKVKEEAIWALLAEADVSKDNCAARLSNAVNLNQYTITYPEARGDFKQIGAVATLPWKSPWRTLNIGPIESIVSSTLIDDISAPNKLKDVSWIHPGAVSWIYWAYNHGSKDFKKLAEYTDFAAEMGWPYTLIDWEWDTMGNGGNIIDAVKYAKAKGIKPLLWYNSGTSWLDPTPWDRLLTPEKRRKEFAWLNDIGVYGIKVDFFAGDQQDMMKYYIEILEDAAKYHLMVNFHGSTLPRGWSRTYPHLMTYEAVYGAEWYNNKPTLTKTAAKHNATLPFIRNVVGAMDYTPVTFSDSQHPHITSYGHELALSVVFESALQHFADRPEAYRGLPKDVLAFLKRVPTTWDDTKLLDGYPGDLVIIARRKGKLWFIGGLNGKEIKQDLTIDIGKLVKGRAQLQLISDGPSDTTFEIKDIALKKKEILKVKCLPRGGFTAILSEK